MQDVTAGRTKTTSSHECRFHSTIARIHPISEPRMPTWGSQGPSQGAAISYMQGLLSDELNEESRGFPGTLRVLSEHILSDIRKSP